MTSRRITVIAIAAAIAALVSILPPIIERLSPPTGLVRISVLAAGIRRRADRGANERNQSASFSTSNPHCPARTSARDGGAISSSRARRRSSSSPAATTRSSCASTESCCSGATWPKA